jgi:hypothetical protein
MAARVALALLSLTLAVACTHAERRLEQQPQGDALGRPVRVVVNPPGTIEAAFDRASYAPGARAPVRLFAPPPRVTVQLFRVGGEARTPRRDDVMYGVPVTQPARVGEGLRGGVLTLRVGAWPTRLYFARFSAPGGAHGFAPFVVRPRTLGEHDVAVVLRTFTWAAYNLRDGDGDGRGDSWYADARRREVTLGRPGLNRGVPYNFRR